LPDWLIAESRDNYVSTALRLIEDDALRTTISEMLSVEHVRQGMYGEGRQGQRLMDLGGNFDWLLGEHEAIQASGQRVWKDGHPFKG
jgi:hypothetical protein